MQYCTTGYNRRGNALAHASITSWGLFSRDCAPTIPGTGYSNNNSTSMSYSPVLMLSGFNSYSARSDIWNGLPIVCYVTRHSKGCMMNGIVSPCLAVACNT